MQIDGFIFFVLTVVLGYFSAHFRFVSEDSSSALPQILISVCYPAMILSTFSQVDLQTLLGPGLAVLVATLVITFILYIASGFFFRNAPMAQQATMRFQSAIGNVTYVTIPLFSIFLGPSAVFIAVMHGAAQDLLIWSLFYSLFAGNSERSVTKTAKHLLSNPCIVALILGVMLKAFDIALPIALQTTVARIGAATTPIALLYLGIMIHKYGFFSWRKNSAAIRYSLYKVALLPVLVTVTMLPFFSIQNAILIGILFGSPAPIVSIIWAGHYGGDVSYAMDCCISSTLVFLLLMGPLCYLLVHCGVLQ